MVGAAPETDAIVAGKRRGGSVGGDVYGEAPSFGERDKRAEQRLSGSVGADRNGSREYLSRREGRHEIQRGEIRLHVAT